MVIQSPKSAKKGPVHGMVLKVKNANGDIESVQVYLDDEGVVQKIIGGKHLMQLIRIEKADGEFFGRNTGIELPANVPGLYRIPLNDGTGAIGVKPSPKLQKDMEFFMPEEDYPCWFEGCRELREKYFQDVAKKQKEYTDMGMECPNCAIGDINRKYIKKLAKLDTSLKEG